ncbi:Hypothetical predicted protein [Paramuricea clavata]|uniref:Uncharacterized protein n=1 Tax=Paramuricea clavata TaxID=317549 RepID=A0A7D9E8Z9_PARCT|nr:Hypothetical predicted protein [Paramuricea clavata]
MIHQSQNENEAKVEHLIGMLYSDVSERNVGKSLTLEILAEAQGIVGAGYPLHCSCGDQTISCVSIKMLMSALASTSLVCLVDDPNINATFSELFTPSAWWVSTRIIENGASSSTWQYLCGHKPSGK